MKGRIKRLTIFASMVFIVALVCSVSLTFVATAKETATISFYAWWGPGSIVDMFKNWANDFHQIHPNLKVKVIAGGTGPGQVTAEGLLRSMDRQNFLT